MAIKNAAVATTTPAEEALQASIDAANENPEQLSLTRPEPDYFEGEWDKAGLPVVSRHLALVDRAAYGLYAVSRLLETDASHSESANNNDGVAYESLSSNTKWGLWQAHIVLLNQVMEGLEKVRDHKRNHGY